MTKSADKRAALAVFTLSTGWMREDLTSRPDFKAAGFLFQAPVSLMFIQCGKS